MADVLFFSRADVDDVVEQIVILNSDELSSLGHDKRLALWMAQSLCDGLGAMHKIEKERYCLLPCDDGSTDRFLAATTVFPCCNSFGRKQFESLLADDAGALLWMIRSAAWVEHLSGVNTWEILQPSLPLLVDWAPALLDELHRQASSSDAYIRWTGKLGLMVLQGQPAPKGWTQFGW